LITQEELKKLELFIELSDDAWERISRYEKLSKDFIRVFQDKVILKHLTNRCFFVIVKVTNKGRV
jgi:hypothetical protein